MFEANMLWKDPEVPCAFGPFRLQGASRLRMTISFLRASRNLYRCLSFQPSYMLLKVLSLQILVASLFITHI